jgi:hypothetical protein
MTENPSLTETVCRAVATAGDLPKLIGDWPEPWPAGVIEMLRADLEGLDRDLKTSNSLVERAAEFRGHYATPPEPVAGRSAASYHELGRDLAITILHRVMRAGNRSASFILSADPFTPADFDRVLNNLPRVAKYLREEAPRFDSPLLVARIRDEAAKAERTPRSESDVAKPARIKVADKRSWTQPELDDAIQAEVTKYSEALASARNRNKGACQTVCKVLGRNALAKRLGVKAAKMVSNSPVWQGLADEFGMRRKSGTTAVSRPTKVALTIAEEAAAIAAGDTTGAAVLRRETVAQLDEAIANVRNPDKQREGQIRQALTDTKDKLTRGEIDDDKARKIVEITQSQQQDDHSRKVLNTL